MLVLNEFLSFGFLDGISNPLIAGFDRTVPEPAPIDASNILTGFTNDKDWSRDGSFLVFRYLFQKVPEFNNFLRTNALKIHPITSESLDPTDGSELLGARLVGRWKSDAPVDLTPFVDNLALANDELRSEIHLIAAFNVYLIYHFQEEQLPVFR